MEAFYTLQGEGYHSGKAAYFIRLGGCDVGCHWCDVKESWDASDFPEISIEGIVSGAREYNTDMVVITGGEPLMYDLSALTLSLQQHGMKTHLETSGVYPVTGEWDWICFSPKKFKEPLNEVYARADELKVVIYNGSDFQWAEQHASSVRSDCKLFLQPEWSRAEKNMPQIISYIKSNPRWQMSLQTHKYLDIP
ncbi:MAG: 7-carboxy-7-deazaguanine synthase [Cyclobacteriaceae bacterium]|nr:MAG: 7-carboxy-7-deazaguanine synthase [Cyclobacteriaceae bacterium]